MTPPTFASTVFVTATLELEVYSAWDAPAVPLHSTGLEAAVHLALVHLPVLVLVATAVVAAVLATRRKS